MRIFTGTTFSCIRIHTCTMSTIDIATMRIGMERSRTRTGTSIGLCGMRIRTIRISITSTSTDLDPIRTGLAEPADPCRSSRAL